jgi:hypothetical protein
MNKAGSQHVGFLGTMFIVIGLITAFINNQNKWIALGAVLAVVGVGMRIESAILHGPER